MKPRFPVPVLGLVLSRNRYPDEIVEIVREKIEKLGMVGGIAVNQFALNTKIYFAPNVLVLVISDFSYKGLNFWSICTVVGDYSVSKLCFRMLFLFVVHLVESYAYIKCIFWKNVSFHKR